MNWLKKILIPNRYDCFYFVLGLLSFLAVTSAFMVYLPVNRHVGAFALLTVVGAMFFAIGAVVGLGRPAWRRIAILGISAALLPPLALLEYYWLGTNQWIATVLLPVDDYTSIWQTEERVPFEMMGKIYAGLFLVPFISGFLFCVIRIGPRRILNFGTGRFRVTRPRLLLVTAISLAVLGIGNNILQVIFPNAKNDFANVPIIVVFAFLWAVICGAIIYLPTRFLVGYQRGWVKVVSSSLALGLMSGAIWFMFLRGPWVRADEIAQASAWGLVVALYFLCLPAVLDPAKQLRGGNSQNRLPSMKGKKELRFPSIWCAVIILTLAGVILIPFRYDVVTLVVARSWEHARNESILRWSSKGQIRRSFATGRALVCNFDETTDPDVMSLLNGTSVSGLWVRGSSPQVDFSMLERKFRPFSLNLSGARVSTRQLNDLLQQPVSTVNFHDCVVMDDGTRLDPYSIDVLYFSHYADGVQLRDGNLEDAKIFAAFESFENVRRISLREAIDAPELWTQVIRASQHSTIILWRGLPNDLTKEQMAQANENIVLSDAFVQSSQSVLTREQCEWLDLSTMKFSLQINSDIGTSRFFQDLIFAYPGRFGLEMEDYGGWEDLSNRSRFVFAANAKGETTEVWLPLGESNEIVASMPELRVLSFDESWGFELNERMPRDVGDLSMLSQLEQLTFSSTSSLDRIDFLSQMKSLKYLQIPAVDRSSQPPTGFDSCPSLEAITMFGEPDSISVNEFRKLPKLSKLTIVDLFDELVNRGWRALGDEGESDFQFQDEYIAGLKKLLPNTEIVIVSGRDFSPVLPESFKRYRDERQATSLKKLHAELADPTRD